MSPGPGLPRASAPPRRGASRRREIGDYENEAEARRVIHPREDRLVAGRRVAMGDRRELANHESARVATADAAGERPLSARGRQAERVLDLELKRGGTPRDGALQAGLGEEHVDAALRVGQR